MSGGWPVTQELSNNSVAGYTATSLTSATATGSSVKGSYIQLTAATSNDTTHLFVQLDGASGTTGLVAAWDVAIGSAGNEKNIINNLIAPTIPLNTGWGAQYSFPINIPANSRVAARVMFNSTGTGTPVPRIGLQFFEGGMVLSEGYAGVDSIGFSTAGTIGTIVLTSGAGIKGAFAQLVASSVRDYAGFAIGLDSLYAPTASGFMFDVAVGSAGNEQIIINNYFNHNNPARNITASPLFQIPIPAGSRIAARASAQQAGGGGGNITLYGIYA